MAMANDQDFANAYGTAVVVDDASLGDATELLISDLSNAITVSDGSGTGTGGSDYDLVCFQLYRDVSDSNDTMNADARLWGVLLEYTTSASTDA
jgi:hypothetical protein